jgi:hypothetical protein
MRTTCKLISIISHIPHFVCRGRPEGREDRGKGGQRKRVLIPEKKLIQINWRYLMPDANLLGDS